MKLKTILIFIMLLFSLNLKGFFAAEECSHQCSGENCPVCQVIGATESIQASGYGKAVIFKVFFFAVILEILFFQKNTKTINSLFRLKTKLSD